MYACEAFLPFLENSGKVIQRHPLEWQLLECQPGSEQDIELKAQGVALKTCARIPDSILLRP
jgi:hypothetical protein